MATKIINITLDEQSLIKQAKKHDRRAQKSLYDLYAPKMLSTCKYYILDNPFAEDVMLKGFYKGFVNIHKFEEKSSFYTWLKKIMSNECIDFLRSKEQKFKYADWNEGLEKTVSDTNSLYELQELEQMINVLPAGCRVVFNLYVIENMKHIEIADKLNISIGTSKSQLSYARNFLQEKIKKIENV